MKIPLATFLVLYSMEINITKSWRKTLSMSFDASGTLQVKAPKLLPESQIDAFIQKNHKWIQKHYEKISERKKEAWVHYLFGNPHPLPKTDWTKKQWESFYKKQAHEYIKPRCQQLAKKYGFVYKDIKISSANTRWGSCSSKKYLNFSYRLVMAPKDCIDYVIIHELCHLKEMNHSARFWKHVSQIMPEYREKEKHLKEYGWRYKL